MFKLLGKEIKAIFGAQTILIKVSNSLDPDQARRSVGPVLGTNCLQRLSADDTSRQRVKLTSV